MLRDRYDPMNVFDYMPALMPTTDPVLAQIDPLLDDDTVVHAVRADLAKHRPHTVTTGRPSTPVEVILRLLAVKRLYGWSYRETERRVSDSLILRQFCRVYFQKVPDHTTLQEWTCLLRPDTLRRFNDRLVALAHQAHVTTGRKVRVDSTVVETTIHYPTDSSLLGDGVRVLGRTLKRARQEVGRGARVVKGWFRDRTRSTKRLVRQIGQATRRAAGAGPRAANRAYRQLLRVTQASLAQARYVEAWLTRQASCQAEALASTLVHFTPLVQQVLDQTTRRVVHGEAVPAAEKLVSLFEPHTRIIRRGKAKPHETEFGHRVWLGEVDGGLISDYRVEHGNPPDNQAQLRQTLTHHRHVFHHPPHELAGDRGVYSRDNEQIAHKAGVKRVSLPQPGHKTKRRQRYERQPWFRKAQRFRVGIEGRISVLKRAHELDRCRDHGKVGFEKWVGWGVIAGNLAVIGRALAVQT